MNQHRRGEVSGREHRHNVFKMRADFVPARGILRVVGFHFDGSAIRIEPEMMCGFLMRKTHHLIPALHHALMVLVLGWRLLLVVGWAHRTWLCCGLFLSKRGEYSRGQNRSEERRVGK